MGREVAADEKLATYVQCPGNEDFLDFTEAEGFEPAETEYGEYTFTRGDDKVFDNTGWRAHYYTLTECVKFKVREYASYREALLEELLEEWD